MNDFLDGPSLSRVDDLECWEIYALAVRLVCNFNLHTVEAARPLRLWLMGIEGGCKPKLLKLNKYIHISNHLYSYTRAINLRIVLVFICRS